MSEGIVKFYDSGKGFGFIQPSDGGTDVFVHASSLKRSGVLAISQGDFVSYTLKEHSGRIQVDVINSVRKSKQMTLEERAVTFVSTKESAASTFEKRISDLVNSLAKGRKFSWGRASSLVLTGVNTEGSKVFVNAVVHIHNADYFPADWYQYRGSLGCDTDTGRYYYWYGFDGHFNPERSFHKRNRIVWSRDLEDLKVRFYASFIEDSRE